MRFFFFFLVQIIIYLFLENLKYDRQNFIASGATVATFSIQHLFYCKNTLVLYWSVYEAGLEIRSR